jgi:hypothetical protein
MWRTGPQWGLDLLLRHGSSLSKHSPLDEGKRFASDVHPWKEQPSPGAHWMKGFVGLRVNLDTAAKGKPFVRPRIESGFSSRRAHSLRLDTRLTEEPKWSRKSVQFHQALSVVQIVGLILRKPKRQNFSNQRLSYSKLNSVALVRKRTIQTAACRRS